ncbi:MAG: hypothetical protein ACOVP2_12745, partial [Armatimonadaceae bacterium]
MEKIGVHRRLRQTREASTPQAIFLNGTTGGHGGPPLRRGFISVSHNPTDDVHEDEPTNTATWHCAAGWNVERVVREPKAESAI